MIGNQVIVAGSHAPQDVINVRFAPNGIFVCAAIATPRYEMMTNLRRWHKLEATKPVPAKPHPCTQATQRMPLAYWRFCNGY